MSNGLLNECLVCTCNILQPQTLFGAMAGEINTFSNGSKIWGLWKRNRNTWLIIHYLNGLRIRQINWRVKKAGIQIAVKWGFTNLITYRRRSSIITKAVNFVTFQVSSIHLVLLAILGFRRSSFFRSLCRY